MPKLRATTHIKTVLLQFEFYAFPDTVEDVDVDDSTFSHLPGNFLFQGETEY